ncbi:tetratricopeptide repeat protein [Sporohalobacter salinus]|uniref:tetratricopeptide repeat protein n=1 Tax=Sporohalobacter salinus TaxID=1494606 RepID=UPI0019604BA5|nr:tetratricopeptide repeat protein [Sporohalobacter salinus]MBM7624750.1 tetratricopeptide (TPR) repeat protein [Sporohalobacter salinus]
MKRIFKLVLGIFIIIMAIGGLLSDNIFIAIILGMVGFHIIRKNKDKNQDHLKNNISTTKNTKSTNDTTHNEEFAEKIIFEMLSENIDQNKFIYTKVVGVTYDNDDGTSRQEILKECNEGEKLKLAKKLAPYLNAGSEINAEITNLTGGANKNLGCNIKINRPSSEDEFNSDYFPSEMYKKAEKLRKRGKIEKAEDKYLEAIETDEFCNKSPDYEPNSRMYEQLAKLYYHTERDNKAIEVLDRYLKIKKDDKINEFKKRITNKDFRRLTNKYN